MFFVVSKSGVIFGQASSSGLCNSLKRLENLGLIFDISLILLLEKLFFQSIF